MRAADEIVAIVASDGAAFDDDVVLHRAIESCLEIMGEASKTVSSEFATSHDQIPWSDVAKVRDRLSHHYHLVDPGQLWTMASVDVPAVADRLDRVRRLRSSVPGTKSSR